MKPANTKVGVLCVHVLVIDGEGRDVEQGRLGRRKGGSGAGGWREGRPLHDGRQGLGKVRLGEGQEVEERKRE